jgi:hypothetical protein
MSLISDKSSQHGYAKANTCYPAIVFESPLVFSFYLLDESLRYCRRLARRMARFLASRRASLGETYHRFRFKLRKTPLLTTSLLNRLSNPSIDSPGLCSTLGMHRHLLLAFYYHRGHLSSSLLQDHIFRFQILQYVFPCQFKLFAEISIRSFETSNGLPRAQIAAPQGSVRV